MAAGGEVLPVLSESTPDLQVDSVARLGRIDLSQRARLDASGNGGGAVLIRGGRLLVDSATIAADNRGNLDGAGLGLDLRITADALITNSALTTDSLGGGRARDLRLTAGSVRLEHGAQISSNTTGPGQGGTVRVTASDTLTLAGTSPDGRFRSALVASAQGTGADAGTAGSVVVEAPHVTLSGGAQISSSTGGPGQGGTVQVTASDTLTLAGTSPDGRFPSGLFARTTGTGAGAGNAGSVVVKAPHVTLTEGARISSDTMGPGRGGTVRVTASDTLTLAGASLNGGFLSGLFANAQGTGADAGNAGSVVIEAPHVTLTEGAQISSLTTGPGQGGTVRVTASDTLTLAGTSPDGRFLSGLFATARGTGVSAGNAGSVVVEAPRVTLSGGAAISSETTGPGQGGTVQVTASDTLTLAGTSPNGRSPSGLFARTTGTGAGAGNADSVVVKAPHVTLTEGARISSDTFGPGQGGTVRVTASDTLTLAGTSLNGGFRSGLFAATEGTGTAGSVVVEAPHVTLTEGARISSSTFGPGRGGTVQVTASDTLTLVGRSPDGRFSSGLFATANGTGVSAGNAGSVVVEAPRVTLSGGAAISSTTSGPGQGGTVTVTTADVLTITGRDSGLRTTAMGSGIGGDIAVDAQQVRLSEGAVISAESATTGNAGSITITVRDMFLSQHSTVTTNASQAKGGNIRVTAPAMVRLQDSQITATVGGGAGDGGNVTIDPDFIILQGSQITANAFAGAGGRIALTASKAFLADPSSVITASSTLGINGQVAIQAPVTSISGAVAPLPQSFAQTTELLRTRCVERLRGGTGSRFVFGGRDGVPLEPGSLLLSPLVQGEQSSPAPITDTVEGQREASFVRVGGLEMPNTGYLYLRGTHVQARWPGALDVECTKWREQ